MVSRAHWLRIHRGLGLGMAVFLFVQALTGALLVYAGPLARLIDPAGMTSRGGGRLISAGEAAARADSAIHGYRVVRFFAPDGGRGTWFAQLRDPEGRAAYASIDPAGGAVRRAGSLSSFPVQAALQIHYQLTIGKAGMVIVTLTGLALVIMAASGLAYWWPTRNPAKALVIRWTLSPRLVLRQVHRTLGVVMAAFLIVMAGTGVLLIVPEIGADSSTPAPSIAFSAAAIDRSLARAQVEFPGSRLRDARVAGGRMTINFAAPERNAVAVHRVVITIGDARPVSTLPASQNTALWISVLPIHTGKVVGMVGPMILIFMAMALAALAVTGPIMWLQAARQRKRAARKTLR